jgi:hypothetical protein
MHALGFFHRPVHLTRKKLPPGRGSFFHSTTILGYEQGHDSERVADDNHLSLLHINFREKGISTMHSIIVKKTLLFLSIFILAALACNLPLAAATPTSLDPAPTKPLVPASETAFQIPASATPVPATEAPGETPSVAQPSFEGAAASYGPLSLTLPPGVASGVTGSQFPRAEGEGIGPWGVTPGHRQIELDGYLLQGRFHQPRIFVYPAQGYAEMLPGAFESIHRLDNILYGPPAPISDEQLPTVPFFNAAQVFASNVRVMSFQGGGGVRFLTEYAQYFAPVNNHDLFYHFQGVTRDGEYYIIAILPITAPALAETSDPGAVVPAGGVALPDINDPNADWAGYYAAVTELLNATSPQAFTPTIDQLDGLIQSIRINP